jgi:hypothetical protein
MVQQKGTRQKLIVTGIGVGILILLIGAFALVRALNPGGDDPYRQDTASDVTTQEPKPTNEGSVDAADDEASEQASDEAATTLDPSTVSSINIEPLGITVSYVNGIGGFEYVIQRTASGTQYVEFRSPELAGTKCTDDAGAFVSILEAPDDNENPTITETKTVDGKKYGLSLTDDTCTGNPELLDRYQASFKDAFSLIKKI